MRRAGLPAWGFALAGWVALGGCGEREAARSSTSPETLGLDPPAAAGAFAPRLTQDGDDLLASWLEPLPAAPGSHRFVVARLADERWIGPFEIARGDDFFANWADVPGVGVAGDGSLLAHWLVKTGADTYAYSIFLARSTDRGQSWTRLGALNDDAVPSEHGFVSWVAEEDGARAIWLDGRAMPEGGAMTLRTARVGATVGPSTVLDERVCECCPTDLVMTARGPLGAYRDRSPEEVRNIGIVEVTGGAPAPRALAEDGWQIPGCPVNGPALDAEGGRVVAAWFTAPNGAAVVQAAFSEDAGVTFEAPRRIDSGRPLGRVDVRLLADGAAVVSWLEAVGDVAELRLRRLPRAGGALEARSIAATAAARASGVPQLARLGDRLFIAWVETGANDASRLRLHALPAASL